MVLWKILHATTRLRYGPSERPSLTDSHYIDDSVMIDMNHENLPPTIDTNPCIE